MSKLPEKRLKVYQVSADVITEMMKFAIDNKVPDDARVHTIFYEPQTNCFGVIVESKEFPAVPEGAVVPKENKIPVLSTDMFVKVTDNMLKAQAARDAQTAALKIVV